MTPARRAAWARYDAAQVNVLAAGALVGMLVDAYEALETRGRDAVTMRELCAQACDGEAKLFEAYARAPACLPTDAAKAAQSRSLAALIRALA